MSQANVEVVKEFTRLFEEGGRDEWREYFDPDVVWDTSATKMPSAGVYHGHAGMERFFRDWLGTWREYAIETREYIDAGDSVVIASARVARAGAAASGSSGTSSASTTWRTRGWSASISTSRARRPWKLPGCGSRTMSQENARTSWSCAGGMTRAWPLRRLNVDGLRPVLRAMEASCSDVVGPRDEHEENVEIARQSFAAFNRSFAEGTSDYYEFLHDEVEWTPITALLDGGSCRGPDAVREWVHDLRQDWETYEIRSNEVRDLGCGRVLTIGTWQARGRRGDVQLSSAQGAWLLELRGGKLIRLDTFTDRTKALEAAGLRA